MSRLGPLLYLTATGTALVSMEAVLALHTFPAVLFAFLLGFLASQSGVPSAQPSKAVTPPPSMVSVENVVDLTHTLTPEFPYIPVPGVTFPFKVWLAAGKWAVECVANLGQVPASGATVFVGATKVGGATGGPVRLLATYASVAR